MSRRVVLDASAALRLVNRSADAAPLVEALSDAALVLAPQLYATEAANALWKYVRAGEIDAATGGERLREALSLVDSFEPDIGLVDEALQEAVARQHPVYDLTYLVLARRHAATLLTCDRKLAALGAALAVRVSSGA